jgi:hypothetical protein
MASRIAVAYYGRRRISETVMCCTIQTRRESPHRVLEMKADQSFIVRARVNPLLGAAAPKTVAQVDPWTAAWVNLSQHATLSCWKDG